MLGSPAFTAPFAVLLVDAGNHLKIKKREKRTPVHQGFGSGLALGGPK
jgi:hypothetical protein